MNELLTCPICQAVWGFDEIQFQECYCCGFPNVDTDLYDNELLECPNCGEIYDDADGDFFICHHCGFDANEPEAT